MKIAEAKTAHGTWGVVTRNDGTERVGTFDYDPATKSVKIDTGGRGRRSVWPISEVASFVPAEKASAPKAVAKPAARSAAPAKKTARVAANPLARRAAGTRVERICSITGEPIDPATDVVMRRGNNDKIYISMKNPELADLVLALEGNEEALTRLGFPAVEDADADDEDELDEDDFDDDEDEEEEEIPAPAPRRRPAATRTATKKAPTTRARRK